jgi:hypothetical protein
MRSLRAVLKAQGVPGCPAGLRSIAPFYRTNPQARKCFGFNRLSQIVHALQWPKGFRPASAGEDYPHNDQQDWHTDPQGIAHDDHLWFITRSSHLETVQISRDLQGLDSYHFNNHEASVPLGNGQVYPLRFNDSDSGVTRIKVLDGYNHLSALSIQRAGDTSILYVPIQPKADSGLPVVIYALEVQYDQSHYDQSIRDWNWKAVITRPGGQGAWCAFDPVAKRLYTSDFYDSPGSTVDVYTIGTSGQPDTGRPVPGKDLQLTFVGEFQFFEADGKTPARLSHLQGGFITDNRHLYLVMDDHTGVVGFDLITGRRRVTIKVNYKEGGGAWYQELEGACHFSNPPAPGMGGDIHVMLFENASNDFWLKHYELTDPSDRAFI